MLITKKLLSVFLCAVLLLLTACSTHGEKYAENELYTIYAKDGEYTLVLKDSVKSQIDAISEAQILEYPVFKSLSDMKRAILAGDISTYELYSLQSGAAKDGGSIPICDVNNLYAPTLPHNISVKDIAWYGEMYLFRLDASAAPVDSCSISYWTEDRFEKDVKGFTEFTANKNIEILSSAIDSATGGTIYEYQTRMGTFTDVLYTLTEGSKVIHVNEMYCNGGCPKIVKIWGIDNGVHFNVVIIEPKSRPTADWLLSFGLVPYVEDAEKA